MIPDLLQNSTMRRLFILAAISTVALCSVWTAARGSAIPPGRAPFAQRSASAPVKNDSPPTGAELNALIDRVLANQQTDDAALPLYQRVERHQIREHASDAAPSDDKTYRIIPIGTGSGWRVTMEDHGHAVSTADYQTQIANVERALEIVTDPTNEKSKRDLDKYRRHLKERADLVAAARDGYSFTWIARESRDGRSLAKIRMDPNPKFKPTLRETEIFSHTVVTLWVDEASAHVARIEAQLNSDYGVGGGVVGKVFRGSHLVIEQKEVAPGVWLPSLYQYDIIGRKFLFGSEFHERTEASRYVRIGPPNEALAFIRRELTPAIAPRGPQ
jgi:hypothetical protein